MYHLQRPILWILKLVSRAQFHFQSFKILPNISVMREIWNFKTSGSNLISECAGNYWTLWKCHTIKIKARCMFVMHEFIPKRIHQTHTGLWSLVNWLKGTMTKYYIRGSCILMRWPDGLDIRNGLGQVQRIKPFWDVIPWQKEFRIHPQRVVVVNIARYFLLFKISTNALV